MDWRIFWLMKITPEQLIQALADQTRLRSILLLKQEGELCVCELMHALDIIQPKISRHLAILRDTDLVSSRRQGQWIYYQLREDLPSWAIEAINAMLTGAKNNAPYSDDMTNLKNMPNRPGSACTA